MTHQILTPLQRDLALTLTTAMDGVVFNDAIAAIISITAASCNNAFDGGTTSRNVAIHIANMIVETVDAGQRGELLMHGQVLQ